jgi:diadenosine tetraphosphatase ApaH/serine/threonine PP2A family protein phosphatase
VRKLVKNPPHPTTPEWQRDFRGRFPGRGEERALAALRMGLFTGHVVLGLMRKAMPEFRKFLVKNGVQKTASLERDFWAEFALTQKQNGSETFVVVRHGQPGAAGLLPTHLNSLRFALMTPERCGTCAATANVTSDGYYPRDENFAARIEFSPSILTGTMCYLYLDSEEDRNKWMPNGGKQRELSEFFGIAIHETTHIAGAGMRTASAYMNSEGYGLSDEEFFVTDHEVVANAARFAWVCAYQGYPPEPDLLIEKFAGNYGDHFTRYLLLYADPEYAKLHPGIPAARRKFLWFFKKLHALYSAHWRQIFEEEEKRAASLFPNLA